MMIQIDAAISNFGATLAIFDWHNKVIMMEFWQSWQLTSWNSLHEQLTNVQKAQEFIQNYLHIVKDIFKDIDQNHPGHVMITTIVTFGPY